MNTNLSAQDLRKIATGMQRNRLLTLSFPDDNAPYHILLVNRLEGEEGSMPFPVEIDRSTNVTESAVVARNGRHQRIAR